jgi:hypothetical protein
MTASVIFGLGPVGWHGYCDQFGTEPFDYDQSSWLCGLHRGASQDLGSNLGASFWPEPERGRNAS